MTLSRSMLLITVLAFTVGMFLFPSTVPILAESATTTISTGLDAAAGDAYSKDLTITVFIGNLIRILLAATGIFFLVLTVYAGILYLTAWGDETKIKTAKKLLTNAIIGLVIIIGAYALSRYVVDALSTAATRTSGT